MPYTIILVKSTDEINAISIRIEFKSTDKFNNRSENRADIIDYSYFIVSNNNASVINPTNELFVDGVTFKVTLNPIYTLRQMNSNVIYNDNNGSAVCLVDDTKTYELTEYWSTKCRI